MLAGIGGKTIEELKRNMSMNEFGTWQYMREQRGGFDMVTRMERGFAMLATLFAQAHTPKGKKAPKMKDFILHRPPEIFGVNDDWDDYGQ